MKNTNTPTPTAIRCGHDTNGFVNALKRNRRAILLTLLATFAWGLLTHCYGFLHGSFSLDSLNEFNSQLRGNDWRIQFGKVFVPAYRSIVRGNIALPWLIGMLSLLYISAAVFLTVKIFDIRSSLLIVLVSGIFVANKTVFATAATYIHDLDCDMLSLALAVLSVYLWKKYDKGFLYGMLPLCLSIGLYQSYISVSITLIIFCLVFSLLDGESFGKAFPQGLKSIGMILGAGGLYFIAMKAVCGISDIAIKSGEYSSIDTVLSMSLPDIIYTAAKGYLMTCYKILTVTSPYPRGMVFAAYAVMAGICGTMILCRAFQKEIGPKEKILTLALTALLPFSMNIIYPLTGGMSHDIMEFGLWLIYLLVLLIAWRGPEWFEAVKPLPKYGQRFAAAGLVLMILWGNVQTANAAYLKKDMEQRACLSLLTRVVYHMESCNGYTAGETPVVFVGAPDTLLDTMPGLDHVRKITGCGVPYAINAISGDCYSAYFDYVLLNPAIMAEPEVWSQMQNESAVADMPCYPKDGSIAMVDGVLVVKLGE